MVLIDTPRFYPFRRGVWASHMISDQPGDAGRDELLRFGTKIGQREAWLQECGSWREHFDVLGDRYQRAVAAGAKAVTPKELVQAMKTKREAEQVGPTSTSGDLLHARSAAGSGANR